MNILIDPLQNITERIIGFLGKLKEPIFEIPGNINNPHVFVTHIYPDHFDMELIEDLINDSTTFYASAVSVEKGISIGLAGVDF
jgi:L-ascorbate metabolism protein UlaG (beta-lactamase superfamily)